MEVSVNFTTENFTQRLDMAQKSFINFFNIWGKCANSPRPKSVDFFANNILEIIKQFDT